MSIEQVRTISEQLAHNTAELNRGVGRISRDPNLLHLEKQDAILTAQREAKEREDALREELSKAKRRADAERQLGAERIFKKKQGQYKL